MQTNDERGSRTLANEAAAVVRSYFERMRAGDLHVVDLFHEDARLVGLGRVTTGKDAIHEFYAGTIERASPSPTLVGELLVAGDRVAAEIEIAVADGASVHAVDLFVVEEGRIRSLTYFLEDH